MLWMAFSMVVNCSRSSLRDAAHQLCSKHAKFLWQYFGHLEREVVRSTFFFFLILMRTDFAAAVHPCIAFRFMPYLREHKPYILENIKITRYDWKFSLLRWGFIEIRPLHSQMQWLGERRWAEVWLLLFFNNNCEVERGTMKHQSKPTAPERVRLLGSG